MELGLAETDKQITSAWFHVFHMLKSYLACSGFIVSHSHWPRLGWSYCLLLQHFRAGIKETNESPDFTEVTKGDSYQSKIVLQYVLVKKLQVFDGNGLFEYPEKKEQAVVIKLCTKNKTKQWNTAGIPSWINSCWVKSQTHSLSMEKQVTGPSAVQVAVLKTSLQRGKNIAKVNPPQKK